MQFRISLSVSFFVLMALIPSSVEAQQGPILVLVRQEHFGLYIGELLKAEGLNEFTLTSTTKEIPSLARLSAYGLVILSKGAWPSQDFRALSNYVRAGGNLLLVSPDERFAGLAGLRKVNGEVKEGYIRIDGKSNIGRGLVTETMQFHGVAPLYQLAGATEIAALFLDDHTPAGFPAVVEHVFGKGRVVSFLYNLPESVVKMHQGNQEWAGQERDGMNGLRQMDMFVGKGEEKNWIDKSKVHIPQADEQIRLLSHAVEYLEQSKMPLPRLWYFPNQLTALSVMTCDGENTAVKDFYEANINTELELVKSKGGTMSVYLIGTGIPEATVQKWRKDGHEVAIHFDNTINADKLTRENMTRVYDESIVAFHKAYGHAGFDGTSSVRNHWITWVGWADQADIEQSHGIGLDLNLYKFDNDVSILRRGWTGGPGFYTGSGIPMRFAGNKGETLNIFQSETQVIDEQLGKQGLIFDTYKILLDRSLDQESYAVITTNIHPNNNAGVPYFDELIRICDYNNQRRVPMWSAERLLRFLRTRDEATFEGFRWKENKLTFSLKSTRPGESLTMMIPEVHQGRKVESVRSGSVDLVWTKKMIKGTAYALFSIDSGKSEEIEIIYTKAGD